MIRHCGLACLSLGLGLALACEKGSTVEAETRDLAEAQKNTGNVAKDLEGQLEQARADVIEIERKLALARDGITDEVLEERKELQNALDSQRRELQEDISEAQREAQALNKDADRAIQQLQQTQPPPPVDGTQPLDSPTRDEMMPVRGVDAPPPSDPPPPDAPPGDAPPADAPPPSAPPPETPNVQSTMSASPSAPPLAPSSDLPPAPPPPAPPSTDPAPVAPVPAP